MTYITRKEWRARASKGGPGPLSPDQVVGVALHWPAMSKPLRGVNDVSAALRGWQDYHMDTNGWSDIGYQEAIDQDGNVYRLRGLRNQSGANGNEDVNERFGAILLVVAPGESLTPELINATRRRIEVHREHFPRSSQIVGHGQIRPGGTACPGPIVQAAIRNGVFKPPAPTHVERGRTLISKGVRELRTADADRVAVHKVADQVADAVDQLPKR